MADPFDTVYTCCSCSSVSECLLVGTYTKSNCIEHSAQDYTDEASDPVADALEELYF